MSRGFNENSRVKIPAIVHLTRLGYKYLSIKDPDIKSQIDPSTNIFRDVFNDSLRKINQVNTPPASSDLDSQINSAYARIKNVLLDSDDTGKSFYDALLHGINGINLIDWNNFSNNTFNVVTELTYKNEGDEFRPDIICLVNGMPLVFIEVKKPNNTDGIKAERDRINERFSNRKFKKFINLTQFMIFSNNMDYDDQSINSLAGAFYAAPAMGKRVSIKFNHFREQRYSKIIDQIHDKDSSTENKILIDNNLPVIKSSAEYQTNLRLDTPTNKIITSLLCLPRLKFILQYAFAYVSTPNVQYPQKHIMRYPQLFATMAISDTLDNGIKKGVIWHTQGSGKTALAYYNVKYLTDYFAKQNKITKFYFIVDRIDLLNQAVQEFTKRGLKTRTVQNKDQLKAEFASANVTTSGNNEICVINIQKFRDDTEAINSSGYDNLNIQRIYFIDEAHRSYDPRGSYLANLYNSDHDSIKIALTGTPLILYKNHEVDSEDEVLSDKIDRKTTVGIFGHYIHKYYYTDSIRDGYTLRLLREDIDTSYREELKNILSSIQVQSGVLHKSDLYAHPRYAAALVDYITRDFAVGRQIMNDSTIGGMIVCSSSRQAREVFKQLQESHPELSVALILHDSDTREIRKRHVDEFKAGKIDLLIVFNMLLTGFDAPRLKRLYLCRIIRAHNLLQTLTRVNRPYHNFQMGYVVDFADIRDEFAVTNERYLEELKDEYSSGVDSSDSSDDIFGSLFISRGELEQRIKQIQNSLKDYNLANAEEFTNQLNQTKDKSELSRVSKSLSDTKGTYNIIRLLGHNDLLAQIDITKINDELNEVDRRIKMINAQDALSSTGDIDSRKLLDLALEDVVFNFQKIGQEELDLSEPISKAKTLVRDIRQNMAVNIDQQDPKFTTLRQEFGKLMQSANIDQNQTSLDNLDRMTMQLQSIYDRIIKLNQYNQKIARQYNDDPKFARVEKHTREFVEHELKQRQQVDNAISDPTASAVGESPVGATPPLKNFLSGVKADLDQQVINNRDIVDNDAFFMGNIMQSLNATSAADNLNIARPIRQYAAQQIRDEYQREYVGEE